MSWRTSRTPWGVTYRHSAYKGVVARSADNRWRWARHASHPDIARRGIETPAEGFTTARECRDWVALQYHSAATFVSVEPAGAVLFADGELLKPGDLIFPGERLELNASEAMSGELRVAMRTQGGFVPRMKVLI